MPRSYPDTIVQEAKRLVETTEMSYPEIAEQLNVNRWMTVWDWKIKHGWKRTESVESSVEIKEIWEIIGEKALGHLQKGEFSSMTEAIKVYDQAMRHIKNAEKKKDAEDSKGGVLEALEVVDGGRKV